MGALGIALVALGPARAEGPGAALEAVQDADPLELARVVASLGDDAVVRSLAKDRPARERLAAVRAAPWLRVPWRALPVLGELAVGRDSELAPAAACAAWRIADAMDAGALARVDSLPEDLAGLRARWQSAAADVTLRVDVRAWLADAAAALAAAGAP